MVKQTAGRDVLGEFAPKFAELNDDVSPVNIYFTFLFSHSAHLSQRFLKKVRQLHYQAQLQLWVTSAPGSAQK